MFVILGPFGRTLLAHGNEVWQECSYLGGMDAIALGCLTAIALRDRCYARSALWMLTGVGTSLLIFILCFSRTAEAWGLGRSGLDMTVLAIGTCMLVAAAAQTGWRSPRLIFPLVRLGQRSYEVYLTHMFVVFALFNLFVASGKSLRAVPGFFVGVILIAAVLGEWVARYYSEPMNRLLRRRWGDGPNQLGSVVAASASAHGIGPKSELPPAT
jgi:peptidoglycan/LPS O-acetylase OafA/YrhL